MTWTTIDDWKRELPRWRAKRDRVALERRVGDLQLYTENVLQNMNSALLVVDMDGHITFCNPPAGKILGEDHEALRGRAVWAWFSSDEEEVSLLARTLSTGVSYKDHKEILVDTFVELSNTIFQLASDSSGMGSTARTSRWPSMVNPWTISTAALMIRPS